MMLYSSKESRDIEIQCITIYLNNYQFVFIQLEVVCQFHIENQSKIHNTFCVTDSKFSWFEQIYSGTEQVLHYRLIVF